MTSNLESLGLILEALLGLQEEEIVQEEGLMLEVPLGFQEEAIVQEEGLMLECHYLYILQLFCFY